MIYCKRCKLTPCEVILCTQGNGTVCHSSACDQASYMGRWDDLSPTIRLLCYLKWLQADIVVWLKWPLQLVFTCMCSGFVCDSWGHTNPLWKSISHPIVFLSIHLMSVAMSMVLKLSLLVLSIKLHSKNHKATNLEQRWVISWKSKLITTDWANEFSKSILGV